MTKQQIQREITVLKNKINLSRSRIDTCSNKIRKLEKAYNESNTLKKKYQNGVQEYYNTVKSSLNRLDTNSTFRDYYISETKKAINNIEDRQIIDLLVKNNNDILNNINTNEEIIRREQNNLNRYYNRMERLKIELSTAV